MENKNNQPEENIINNKTNVPDNLRQKDGNNEEILGKNSPMNNIKNMFDLNQNRNPNQSTFHNSLKFFKKKNLNTNSETSHIRTKSNENKKEEQMHMSTKNFPSKANVCKGNVNINSNMYIPPKSSPIVQYYGCYKNGGQDSLENLSNLGYLGSPQSPYFNFSPSKIFNINKNASSGMMNEKSGKVIEPMFLNNPNDEQNSNEKFEYDSDKYNVLYNEETELNNQNQEQYIININGSNKHENEENNKENNNDICIAIKENDPIKKIESSENINDDIPPIQNAMKKLRKKKNKASENSSNVEKGNNKIANIINMNNEQTNINNNHKEGKVNYENDDVLGNIKTKNVLNYLDDGILFEEKDKINKSNDIKVDQEIKYKKYSFDNHLSNVNNFAYNNINTNSIPNNYPINNNIYHNAEEDRIKNNNIINDDIIINKNIEHPKSYATSVSAAPIANINNSINNNYNSLIQFNYLMNNNNGNYYNPNQNIDIMKNNELNTLNNNNIYYSNFLNNGNISNNNNFNNNYNISQRMNQYNMNPMKNNMDIQKYNNLLPNSGNINIQNNYFLYNNDKDNINNEQINKEEKKRKKKKKVKKLEQNIYMNKPISYYLDNFTTMARDQGASRYLQNLLNDYSPEDICTFYPPLCKNILKLINDPFANYLIQKIISYLSQEQLHKLLVIISDQFYEISCNPHGTRVLQKLIELIKTPELRTFFYELVRPIVCQLLKDLNGTYIVQKFVKYNLYDYGIKINQIIIDNSVELCTFRHGCCVIQKYLETRDQNMLPQLIYKLLDGFNSLIIDQFGNYVIKTILFIGNPEYNNRIGEYISMNIVFYSKHKYSSNVVEKCFDFCQGFYLNKLIFIVQQENNLKELILDEHGNYVVQKVLSISNMKKKKEMLSVIKSLFPLLRQTHFGERIIHRISMTYPNIYNL